LCSVFRRKSREVRTAKILVIEDNDTMREGMVEILNRMSLNVAEASDGKAALAKMQRESFDLVVTDYRLPGMNGIELLCAAGGLENPPQVMIITAYGSIELAVEAMKKGAIDFITKPFSHDEFRLRVTSILQQLEALGRISDENRYLREEIEQHYNFGEIIGSSNEMKAVFRTLAKVARTDSSVIIYGESGTGKELAARAIHKNSSRGNFAFIRINCGALSEGVLESELFGHERGAFTGAVRRKRGRFELADRGTLFLDEIGDLPPSTQIKLLRVLQEREFERVGGEETLRVDVRVIAATHRDLKKLVAEGRFRTDLFYRIHIVPVTLPPLRDRIADIPELADCFLQRLAARLGRAPLSLSGSALESLCAYAWPGNVRELENVLERCAVLCDGEAISAQDLVIAPAEEPGQLAVDGTLDLNAALARVEREAIERALIRSGGVKTECARLLGIKTSALYYKLEKYGLGGK